MWRHIQGIWLFGAVSVPFPFGPEWRSLSHVMKPRLRECWHTALPSGSRAFGCMCAALGRQDALVLTIAISCPMSYGCVCVGRTRLERVRLVAFECWQGSLHGPAVLLGTFLHFAMVRLAPCGATIRQLPADSCIEVATHTTGPPATSVLAWCGCVHVCSCTVVAAPSRCTGGVTSCLGAFLAVTF